MVDLVVSEDKIIERILTMELVRVTERAAVASAKLRGRGNEKAADQAAVDAMRRELNRLPIDGTIVIGEGERDEARCCSSAKGRHHQGAEGGYRGGPARRHNALRQGHAGLDRRDGDGPGRHAAIRADVYMDKIAIGRAIPRGSSISMPRRKTTSWHWPRPRV